MVWVRAKISPELHNRLKLRCVVVGEKLKDYLPIFIERGLNCESKKQKNHYN